jgi:hypothetical protein
MSDRRGLQSSLNLVSSVNNYSHFSPHIYVTGSVKDVTFDRIIIVIAVIERRSHLS